MTTTVREASSKSVFDAIPRLTVKGEAIHRLAAVAGEAYEHNVLGLAADVVDRETITVGRDAFQLVVINTDTNSNSTVLDSTSAADVRETITAHGLVRGSIVRCEAEFLNVKEVVDANTVVLGRGYAGSTIASHADASDLFKKGATALTAGKAQLPLGATLTPAAAGPLIAAGMTALGTLGWVFSYAANFVTGFRVANGVHDAMTETLGGTGNAWHAASSYGGVEIAGRQSAVSSRVPTAAEVTAGVMAFKFPFTPTFVRVSVVTTATWATVAWGGAFAVAAGVVTLTNGTNPDWSAAETVTVEAFA